MSIPLPAPSVWTIEEVTDVLGMVFRTAARGGD
jgi:hypothetical protein